MDALKGRRIDARDVISLFHHSKWLILWNWNRNIFYDVLYFFRLTSNKTGTKNLRLDEIFKRFELHISYFIAFQTLFATCMLQNIISSLTCFSIKDFWLIFIYDLNTIIIQKFPLFFYCFLSYQLNALSLVLIRQRKCSKITISS